MKQVVLLQILVIWIVAIWIYCLTARRDGRVPADDIGVVWLGVFALYATLPPISWLIQGSSYGPLGGRLFQLQPSSQEVIALLNIALAYYAGFAPVFIVLLRQVNRPSVVAQARIGFSTMVGAVVILIVAILMGVILNMSGLIRSAVSYVDSYKVVYELPSGLRQLLKVVAGFKWVAILTLLVAVLQRWPKYRVLFVIYLLALVFSISSTGSRGGVVIGLLSIVIAWHVLVRPIPPKRMFTGVAIGLIAFLLLGIWRHIGSLSDINNFGLEGVGVGEFDALWANAVELLQMKQKGGINVEFPIRFGELFAFIPSQLLWFEKTSLNNWFLDNFYPSFKEIGGGWAFGAISQAVIGGGVLEAVLRGAIIGALAGWIMKWVRTPTKAWWRFPLQISLLVGVFAGIRETTFIQWGDVVQTWLFSPMIIVIIGDVFTKSCISVFPLRKPSRRSYIDKGKGEVFGPTPIP